MSSISFFFHLLHICLLFHYLITSLFSVKESVLNLIFIFWSWKIKTSIYSVKFFWLLLKLERGRGFFSLTLPRCYRDSNMRPFVCKFNVIFHWTKLSLVFIPLSLISYKFVFVNQTLKTKLA